MGRDRATGLIESAVSPPNGWTATRPARTSGRFAETRTSIPDCRASLPTRRMSSIRTALAATNRQSARVARTTSSSSDSSPTVGTSSTPGVLAAVSRCPISSNPLASTSMAWARVSASLFVPTMRVRRVSWPSRRAWRIRWCHAVRVASRNASDIPHTSATHSRLKEAFDQNDTATTSMVPTLTAARIRRNSSLVDRCCTAYRRCPANRPTHAGMARAMVSRNGSSGDWNPNRIW